MKSWVFTLLNFIVLSQYSPAVLPLHYDLIIFFIFMMFLLNRTQLPRNFLLFSLALAIVIFSHRIYYINTTYYRVQDWILSDLRIIVVAYLVRRLKVPKGKIGVFTFLFLISFPNFLINIVALIDDRLFRQILNIWHNDVYGIKSYSYITGFPATTSYVASLQNRYCGFFLQPSSAGVVSVILGFLTWNFYKIKAIGGFASLTLGLMFFFNGILSQSSVFYAGFICFLSYYAFKNYFIIFVSASLAMTLIALIILTIDFKLIDLVVFGNRFSQGSNLRLMFSTFDLNAFNYLFGINPLNENFFGKGIGDSGYILRFLGGGIFYTTALYTAAYWALSNTISSGNLDTTLKRILYSIFFFLILVEIGSGGFSNPQVTFLIFSTIYVFGKRYNERQIQHHIS